MNFLTVVIGFCGLMLFTFAFASHLPIKWSMRRCLIYIAIAAMSMPVGFVWRNWLTSEVNVSLAHQMQPIHRYPAPEHSLAGGSTVIQMQHQTPSLPENVSVLR